VRVGDVEEKRGWVDARVRRLERKRVGGRDDGEEGGWEDVRVGETFETRRVGMQ